MKEDESVARGKYKRKHERKLRRSLMIQDTTLSSRVISILTHAGISNLYELDCCSYETLSALPGIGQKSLQEIATIKKSDC